MAINLSKGGRIDLSKNDKGEAYSGLMFFGANWGMITRKGGFFSSSKKEAVDLDASVICLDASNKETERVYFGRKSTSNGSIKHSGDDLTGDEDGDDGMDNETISVDLSKIDSKTDKIVFILNSYQHHQFDDIPYMGLRIYNTVNNRPITRPGQACDVLATYDLKNESNDPETTFKDREAIILGYAYRKDGGWKFKACGNTSNSRSINEIVTKDIPKIF